jgi:hypothetical protein
MTIPQDDGFLRGGILQKKAQVKVFTQLVRCSEFISLASYASELKPLDPTTGQPAFKVAAGDFRKKAYVLL